MGDRVDCRKDRTDFGGGRTEIQSYLISVVKGKLPEGVRNDRHPVQNRGALSAHMAGGKKHVVARRGTSKEEKPPNNVLKKIGGKALKMYTRTATVDRAASLK